MYAVQETLRLQGVDEKTVEIAERMQEPHKLDGRQRGHEEGREQQEAQRGVLARPQPQGAGDLQAGPPPQSTSWRSSRGSGSRRLRLQRSARALHPCLH